MKTSKQDQVPLIHLDKKQVKVLASIACSEVFAALSSIIPKSKREVALELSKSPASVGPHVDSLLKVGLVIEAGERKRRSRIETLYLLKAHTARMSLEGIDKATLVQYQKRVRGQLRLFERQIETAQGLVAKDPSMNLYISYKWRNGYFSPENALKVKAAIQDLMDMVIRLSETEEKVIEEPNTVRLSVVGLICPTLAESKRLAK